MGHPGCVKKLIVNADDFGFTPGVNAGIVEAFRSGIVTSTTIMANGEAFDEAAELAFRNPGMAVGCHLSLVGGRPVAPLSRVPSLADSQSRMPATVSQFTARLLQGRIRTADIEWEFRAQLEHVLAAGIQPTHLDTHKHVHAHPRVMEALCRVAAAMGIRKVRYPFERVRWLQGAGLERWRSCGVYLKQCAVVAGLSLRAGRFRKVARSEGLRMPDHFCGMALTGLLDASTLDAVLSSLQPGVTELACHPGVWDEDLQRAPTRLKRERQRELEALAGPAARRRVAEEGIMLISYRELN